MPGRGTKLKILHLEDLLTDAELVARELRKCDFEIDLKLVSTKHDYIDALQKFDADIILSDHSLPSINSFEALQLALQQQKIVPFILITSTVSEEYAVDIMKEGAYDYILKDRLQRLPSAVHNAIERWIDQEEKRKYFELVKTSEERYRQILETAQEGIWMVDENSKTVFVNKRMSEMIGYSIQEMMGKPNYHFMEGKVNRVADVEEPMASYQSHDEDTKLIAKDGAVVWVNLANSPVLDKHGNYVGALAMVTDITKKKLYEESLHKSEANIRTIFENASTAYILLDVNFIILSFNHVAQLAAENHLEKQLVEGRNFVEYFQGQRQSLLKESYKRILNGSKNDYEIFFDEKDGTKTWYNARFSKVVDDKKKLLGLVIAATDISERKEMELQRERITADLMLRNKDLEQFTYIVSHNLRAPVANILGISNILKGGNMSADILEGLSDSIKSLDNVIIDLNTILQLKREHNERKERVDFISLVDEIKLSLADQLKRENVKLITWFDSVNEWVTIRSYIHSIFFNLISNSIRYRQPNIDPVIEIKSTKTKHGIGLKFSDNGLGIDLKRRGDQVFGLYKRFHTETKEGKGMGLFMVKAQVEALGGKIYITSEVNKGTEFRIEF